MSETARRTRVRRALRRLGYTAYFRTVAFNYDRQLVARPNRTPAGTVWTYDLLNRHGRDEMLAAIAAACGPDDVVYDVGANVGIYALALAATAPDRHVFAFEPSPPAVERLRANVARNRLADSIEIHACGLGEQAGERPFHISTYPELSAFDRESATRWEASVRETVSVPVCRLDDCSLPAPDVIKLDVEGAGPAVLRGARETLESARPALFVETHEDGLPGNPTAAMRRTLGEMGYDIDKRDGFWVCRG